MNIKLPAISLPFPAPPPLVFPFLAKDAGEEDARGSHSLFVVEKSIDTTRRTVDFVASTDIVDSHGEIVDQNSWRLDDYLKNPVVLFAHNSRELPIGRCIDLSVRNGGRGQQLECRIEFASEEMNPKAEQVFRMVQEKFLRAVSVGFVPKSYRWEMRDGEEIWVWADCILKEISVTPVPANPETLAKMKSKALTERNGPANPSSASNMSPASSSGINPTNVERETKMDLKELQDRIEKLTAANAKFEVEIKTTHDAQLKAEADLRALEGKCKTLETENAALVAQAKTLAEARDAEKAAKEAAEKALAEGVKKAQDEAAEAEVTALVTTKTLDETEKDVFVELRKSNPTLFAKMIAQRGPAKGAGDPNLTKSVLAQKGAENGAPTSLDSSVIAKEALSEIEKLGGTPS